MSQTEDTILNGNKKQWTLMFFFASDNTLSPSMLPQIKAIKAAGPPNNANVLVYFDPNEQGAPTRVFNINKNLGLSSNGNSGDPVISILSSDYVSPEEIKKAGSGSEVFAQSLKNSDSLKAIDALKQFLYYCCEAYDTEHYMLFLVGHGLVVGRDAFLPDDNPDSAIGLTDLKDILIEFRDKSGKKLDLIGMHSCSMSAVEVAYELQGTANYMLASQGLSFVGSWPYRQLLTKIYNSIQQTDVKVDELAKSLHTMCIKYSVDFIHAGYSTDMCLCSLDPDRVTKLKRPISKLATALTEGVKDRRCRSLILLAHLRSQSYWQETYTDLYDFCLCLQKLCEQKSKDGKLEPDQGKFQKRAYDFKRIAIIDACKAVKEVLTPDSRGPVVCSDYVGPDVQYSHGLSIYFPWSKPKEDANDQVIKNYEDYAFTSDFVDAQPWFQFLEEYFKKTQRDDRATEEKEDENPQYTTPEYTSWLKIAQASFPGEVLTGTSDVVSTSTLEGKITPPDSGGGGCSCASSKNYSRVFSMSPGVAPIFDSAKSNFATAGAGGITGGSPTGGSAEQSQPADQRQAT